MGRRLPRADAGAGAQARPGRAGDADSYDRWFALPWGQYAFAVEAGAVRRAAGALGNRRVLDAGCGTGRFGAALAATNVSVLGVDADPGMLALAQHRLARCVRADAGRLPFADAMFDVTVAVTLLEFVGDPAAQVAELARVTRAGGRIVVGALNPRSPWGVANRRRLRSGDWCHARFLSRQALRHLAAPYGRVEQHAVLYAPRWLPGLRQIGPLLELAGRVLPGWGAFQVFTIRKAR